MKIKKIVHIANNFVSSQAHLNLIQCLQQRLDIKQEVYIPVRRKIDIGINNKINNRGYTLNYSYCFKSFFKYFPLLKVLWVTIDSFRKMRWGRLGKDDVLIAHTLWSDGMVAFFVHLVKRKKYILIVRNTDINIFLPRLPHYRFLIKWSISRSKALVFVSHAHKERFCYKYPMLHNAANVINVISNGLDDFWLRNISRNINKRVKRVVYVGKFDRNKNLLGILNAVENARRDDPNILLTLVGGNINELNKLCKLKKPPSWVKVIEHIYDKNCLINIYRESNVFLMPSYHETFGLVYLEALSQGLPFIYTKGEGIDGYFDNEDFALAVEPNDIDKISDSILLLLKLFPSGVPHDRVKKKLSNFSWRFISKKYHKLIEL